MELLILFGGLLLAFACIAFELYFIYAIVISKSCKYPPAFPSFGNMKKLTLIEARRILNSCDEGLKVIDLGSGAGGLLLPLAKEFPQHQFCGYDWDWLVCKILHFRARNLPNLTVCHKNFMKADFENYDLILCFLDTRASEDLSLDLKKRIQPNTVIVSLAFELKGMSPSRILDAKSYGMPIKVYVYERSLTKQA